MQFDNQYIKTNSELRRSARERLSGNWGTAILLCIMYSIISSIPSCVPHLGFILSILLTGPLSLGLNTCFLHLVRGEPFVFEDLFDGFKNFSSAVISQLLITIFVCLWTLILIIPGIIAGYNYSQVFYILIDNPEIGASEALKRSKRMMVGFKWKLFCLHLSFIGWSILAIFTIFIGFIWLIPYINVSAANFYSNIKAAEISKNTYTF